MLAVAETLSSRRPKAQRIFCNFFMLFSGFRNFKYGTVHL